MKSNLQVSPPEVDCECVKYMKPAMERGEDIEQCRVCGHYYWKKGRAMHFLFHDEAHLEAAIKEPGL